MAAVPENNDRRPRTIAWALLSLVLVPACGKSRGDLDTAQMGPGSGGFGESGAVPLGGAAHSGAGGTPSAGGTSQGGAFGGDGQGSGGDSAGVGGSSAVDAGPTGPALGSTPWRSSPQSFCALQPGRNDSLDVWSDSRGVFVLTATSTEEVIFSNDGAGWAELRRSASEGVFTYLSGFADGALVKYGGFQCAIRLIVDGEEHCSAAVDGVLDFHAETATLAYASAGDRLLTYDGSVWTQFGAVLEPTGVNAYGVWSGGGRVVAAATGSVYVSEPEAGQGLVAEPGLPLQNYLTAYVTDDGTTWVGAQDGLWRDSTNEGWEVAWPARESCSDTVRHLWSDGQSVFFATNSLLGVYDDTGAHVLGEWPCESSVTVTGLWGNSATEVFVSLRDGSRDQTDCGEPFLLWYDGVALNPL